MTTRTSTSSIVWPEDDNARTTMLGQLLQRPKGKYRLKLKGSIITDGDVASGDAYQSDYLFNLLPPTGVSDPDTQLHVHASYNPKTIPQTAKINYDYNTNLYRTSTATQILQHHEEALRLKPSPKPPLDLSPAKIGVIHLYNLPKGLENTLTQSIVSYNQKKRKKETLKHRKSLQSYKETWEGKGFTMDCWDNHPNYQHLASDKKAEMLAFNNVLNNGRRLAKTHNLENEQEARDLYHTRWNTHYDLEDVLAYLEQKEREQHVRNMCSQPQHPVPQDVDVNIVKAPIQEETQPEETQPEVPSGVSKTKTKRRGRRGGKSTKVRTAQSEIKRTRSFIKKLEDSNRIRLKYDAETSSVLVNGKTKTDEELHELKYEDEETWEQREVPTDEWERIKLFLMEHRARVVSRASDLLSDVVLDYEYEYDNRGYLNYDDGDSLNYNIYDSNRYYDDSQLDLYDMNYSNQLLAEINLLLLIMVLIVCVLCTVIISCICGLGFCFGFKEITTKITENKEEKYEKLEV